MNQNKDRVFIADSETGEGTTKWSHDVEGDLAEHKRRKVSIYHSYWDTPRSKTYTCIGIFNTVEDIPADYDFAQAAKQFPELFI